MTDKLGSRLERPIHFKVKVKVERPIHFECKLNEPMYIDMRLLHPAVADHSVSISRQQVHCIFSFLLRSRAVTFHISGVQVTVQEHHQRLYSRTLCQTMEPGKHAPHTQTPPRSTPRPGPCVPPHCPTAGTLVVPLVWFRGAGELPSRLVGSCGPSDSAIAIQFARRPPKFKGIHLTAVKAADVHVLCGKSLSYW